MSEDCLHQMRPGFVDDASQSDGPPDLGPLRALAEREELADATGRLADAYGRPLRDDDPLRPLASDAAHYPGGPLQRPRRPKIVSNRFTETIFGTRP